MPFYRVTAATYKSTEMVRDRCLNTFYLESALLPLGDVEAIADDAAELFGSYRPKPEGWDRVTVTVYAMSDPLPRPPLTTRTFNASGFTASACGPREVALCLSYYAGLNRARQRGRMYIGPWQQGNMQERPTPAIRDQLITLANGIAGLGGANVDWVQHSPTAATYSDVSDVWVDDEWDTVRSRGLRGTTRTTAATGP